MRLSGHPQRPRCASFPGRFSCSIRGVRIHVVHLISGGNNDVRIPVDTAHGEQPPEVGAVHFLPDAEGAVVTGIDSTEVARFHEATGYLYLLNDSDTIPVTLTLGDQRSQPLNRFQKTPDAQDFVLGPNRIVIVRMDGDFGMLAGWHVYGFGG